MARFRHLVLGTLTLTFLSLFLIHCGGTGTESAGGGFGSAGEVENLLEGGLATATQEIVSDATKGLKSLGSGELAGLAVDGSNYRSESTCQGGGTASLLLHLTTVESEVLGSTYVFQGNIYFVNCGPTQLNGNVKFELRVGAIPSFCLTKACANPLPVTLTISPDAGGDEVEMQGHVVQLLSAVFEGHVQGPPASSTSWTGLWASLEEEGPDASVGGNFSSGDGVVGPWFCAISGDGVHCRMDLPDADDDGVPDEADN